MKKHVLALVSSLAVVASALTAPGLSTAAGQAGTKLLPTNKAKLLTLAVQGVVGHAQPSRSYITTWDGKSKMAIGSGGINYSLKVGDKVFGWAGADRATVGVAAEGADERSGSSWATMASIGNEARLLGGEARGSKGIVVGKSGNSVLLHFADDVLDKLAIGDALLVKSRGPGLEIEGAKDIIVHNLAPELLEQIASLRGDGRVEVSVVKVIPAKIVGQGSGGSALFGNWHIQTCYPPDIKKYGLDELRYGDLVFLEDTQTDYGKGYYQGGATVGVVSAGPSDISGLGIGVTPVLSTRFGRLAPKIDPAANFANHLGIKIREKAVPSVSAALGTNRENLVVTAVQAVVQPPRGLDYGTAYDGAPKADVGMASINYTVSVGDSAYGWAAADHVEPDVTIQGRDRQNPGECAVAILACIGNEARVVSGEAAGARGFYLGRHAGADDLVWFPRDVLEKLALNDKIQVKSEGVGLKIDGFEDVRVNKLSPGVLEKLGLTREGGALVVPVVMEVPGTIMGSGIGGNFIEYVDYDIQTTDPRTVEQYGLKRLRIGDLVAIRDHYDYWGRGRYEGAVTIGVCIHGFSDYSGHGPGLNPVLSALPGKIKTRLDPNSNVAYALGIREKPKA